MSEALPLAGIQVVAFEQAVSAPLCSRHLSDLGADVIKIERRGEGDFARAYDSLVNGTSSYFAWLNHGKRSLTLDITKNEGQDIAHRLVAEADVVLQNFSPGSLDRRGLGVGQLHERYPRLIACSITGYGEAGPYRDRKAYDALLQAEGGVISITGTPADSSKCGVPLVDFSAGVYALSSILAALYRRRETGEGAAIRISLFDSIMEWMGIFALQAKGGNPPKRSGAFHPNIVPYGPYRARDGSVMLAVHNDREWEAFCRGVVQRPEWQADPLFARNEDRLQNRKTLEPMIEKVLGGLSVEEAESRLEQAGIAYARSNDVTQLLAHPQLRERDRFLRSATNGDAFEVLRPPFNIEGIESVPGAVPAVGEHTEEVLIGLGLSRTEIDGLRAADVI